MRLEYETQGISEADFAPDPIEQFGRWMRIAVEAELDEPNAMVVSTVDADGQPWSRYVLLKGVSSAGFEFFTNYESDKSHQLAHCARAALTFGWLVLRRQVNVAGTVERLTPAESDDYWALRPRGAQLSAWASNQSRPVANRQELLDRYDEVAAAHPEEIPRPPHWGGWRVRHHTVEFWQGRLNRLHDRLRYVATGEDDWKLVRLAP